MQASGTFRVEMEIRLIYNDLLITILGKLRLSVSLLCAASERRGSLSE
jgi:hypothetical protein